MIFSKMQFTYTVAVKFISIRKCACSPTPIVISADGKEHKGEDGYTSCRKKAQKEADER